MVDNAETIEKYELELWNTIYKMHRDGIRFEVCHQIMQEMVKTLEMQGYCGNWLGRFNSEAH
jgi:hypothetical protein